MTRKNLVKFATVMMMAMVAMVCNAQGFSEADAAELEGLNFNWNAKVVKAAPAAKTTTRATRSVSVNQLAQVSSRRSNTARRASAQQTAYAAPAQNYSAPQNDLQSQLNAAVSANSAQKVIIGVVEHNYIEDISGTTTLIVRTSGFGGSIRKFTMKGYRDYVIPVYAGDYVCFIATYGQNGMNEYPLVVLILVVME